MHKLQHALDSLENTAALRHEEDKMMGLTKTAMLKAIQLAKTRQLPGFEDLPLRDQMRSATFAKEDLVRQLAETLNLGGGRCGAARAECSCFDATTAVTPTDAIAQSEKSSVATNIRDRRFSFVACGGRRCVGAQR